MTRVEGGGNSIPGAEQASRAGGARRQSIPRCPYGSQSSILQARGERARSRETDGEAAMTDYSSPLSGTIAGTIPTTVTPSGSAPS